MRYTATICITQVYGDKATTADEVQPTPEALIGNHLTSRRRRRESSPNVLKQI